MSANRIRTRNELTKQEARWLAQARKKRGLGEYDTTPRWVAPERRLCPDCNVPLRGQQVRCAVCQVDARRRAKAKAGSGEVRLVAPRPTPRPEPPRVIRHCADCGEPVKTHANALRTTVCRPCRKTRKDSVKRAA